MSPLYAYLLLAAPALPAPSISFLTTGATSGAELTGGSSWLDDDSVEVYGVLSGLDVGGEADYSVVVNGVFTGGCDLPGPTGYSLSPSGRWEFGVLAPIGDGPPDWWTDDVFGCGYRTTRWPTATPYTLWLDDNTRVLRPVLAELLEPYYPGSLDYTGELVARKRFVLYDLRGWPELNTEERPETVIEGMWAQLTPTGISALSATLTSMLPFPSVEDVNADLAESAADMAPLTDDIKACFTLSGTDFEHLVEYNSAFHGDDKKALDAIAAGTATGIGALQQADIAYAAYIALETATWVPVVGWAAGIVADAMCVDDLPTASDFEVCVRDLRQDVTDLSIEGVESGTLSMGSGPTLNLNTTVNGVKASVTAHLDDVVIRWKESACVARPSAEVDMSDTDGDREWLGEWGTCDDLSFDADMATHVALPGGDAAVQMNLSSSLDGELIDVDSAERTQWLLSGVSVDTGDQTCAESFIVKDVNDLLDAWRGPVTQALEDGWDARWPETGEAEALATLLDPLGLGATEPSHYHLDAEIGHLDGTMRGGLEMSWYTNTSSRDEPELDSWVYMEADPPVWSPKGLDPDGNPFDLSFSVTTGHLNQVLRSVTNSDALIERPLKPTYGDLFYTEADGVDPDAVAALDPDVLAGVHEALGDITVVKGEKLALYLRPTMAPFVAMPVDPIGVTDLDHIPLQLEAGRLIIELRSDADVGASDGLWVRFEADLHDPDLQLDLEAGTGFIVPSFSDDRQWTTTITDMNLPDCERSIRAFVGVTCEDELQDALGVALQPTLDEIVLSMLSELPAPTVWDGAGFADLETEVELTDRYQAGQVITWTTLLRPAGSSSSSSSSH